MGGLHLHIVDTMLGNVMLTCIGKRKRHIKIDIERFGRTCVREFLTKTCGIRVMVTS